jgi:hypothetical protein
MSALHARFEGLTETCIARWRARAPEATAELEARSASTAGFNVFQWRKALRGVQFDAPRARRREGRSSRRISSVLAADILRELSEYMSADGVTYVRQTTVMEDCGHDERTVREALHCAARAGLLVIFDRRGLYDRVEAHHPRSNIYMARMPAERRGASTTWRPSASSAPPAAQQTFMPPFSAPQSAPATPRASSPAANASRPATQARPRARPVQVTPTDSAEERAILAELQRSAQLADIATRANAARLALEMTAARVSLSLFVRGLAEYAAAVIRGDEPADAGRAGRYGLKGPIRGARGAIAAATPEVSPEEQARIRAARRARAAEEAQREAEMEENRRLATTPEVRRAREEALRALGVEPRARPP